MSTIQQLSHTANWSIDLYLQTDYKNQSFIWFITIGFWYSSLHYKFHVDSQGTIPDMFPICSNMKQELPETFHKLCNNTHLTYVITSDHLGQDILLLTMKKLLLEFFPPTCLINEHPMLTQWLYSVPFPPPPKSVSWTYDNGNGSLLGHIEEMVWKKCQPEQDTSDEDTEELHHDEDIAHTNSPFLIEQFDSDNTFMVSLASSKNKNLFDKTTPFRFGNEFILQYALPHTSVKNICNSEEEDENTSWFHTVFTNLYGNNTKFQMNEFKNCLFAFWQRYGLIHPEHKILQMWNQFFQKITTLQAPSIQHLNAEARQLKQSNGDFNAFFIHVFCRMLLQQGFQDDSEPFCIGCVVAEWISHEHGQHIYEISFEPKWKPPDGIKRYLYIGKAFSKLYSILPEYDPKIQYRVRCAKY